MPLQNTLRELSEQLNRPAHVLGAALKILPKPVRLQALLTKATHLPLYGEGFTLDPPTRQVSFADGRPVVTLTEKEALLLAALLRSPNAPPSKEDLQREVLGYNERVESDALAALGYRLRQKLGEIGNGTKILT